MSVVARDHLVTAVAGAPSPARCAVPAVNLVETSVAAVCVLLASHAALTLSVAAESSKSAAVLAVLAWEAGIASKSRVLALLWRR